MRPRLAYRPTLEGALESRVVLSGYGRGGFRGTSVLLQGLHPRTQAIGARGTQSVIALTNLAFDKFIEDYTQARSVYFSTLSTTATPATTNATSARAAFTQYTNTRVDLLSQQVISNVLQSSSANTKQKGNGPTVQTLVFNNLNGRDNVTTGSPPITTVEFRGRTLGKALIDTIPAAQSGPEAAALSALAQDQAIESARAGVMNGLTIMRNGDYGNKRYR